MPEEKKPFCPRCEREAAASAFTPEKLAEIAEGLPSAAGVTADPDTWRMRLAICGQCDALREKVLCSWCGCFVALRARASDGYCPYPGSDKWKNLDQKP